MREFEIILKALANSRRLAILKKLKSKKELTVGDIFFMSISAVFLTHN